MHLFPEMLLQDVEETTNFLTCIVEVFHFPGSYLNINQFPCSCFISTSIRLTDIFYMSLTTLTILTCQLLSQRLSGRTILNIA